MVCFERFFLFFPSWQTNNLKKKWCKANKPEFFRQKINPHGLLTIKPNYKKTKTIFKFPRKKSARGFATLVGKLKIIIFESTKLQFKIQSNKIYIIRSKKKRRVLLPCLSASRTSRSHTKGTMGIYWNCTKGAVGIYWNCHGHSSIFNSHPFGQDYQYLVPGGIINPVKQEH